MAVFDVPNFPTESLHKFRAIVGLVLMFAGVFYIGDGLATQLENLKDIETKVSIFKIKSKYANNTVSKEQVEIYGAQMLGEANKAQFIVGKLALLSIVNVIVFFYGAHLYYKGFKDWERIQKLIDNALEKGSDSKAA